MASYYYLISSLPMLRTQGEPPMDYATFLSQCRSAVSEGTYKTLEELTVRSGKGAASVRMGRILPISLTGADLSAQCEAGPGLPCPL